MIKLTADVIHGFVKTILSSKFDDAAETPAFHKEAWGICCTDNPKIAIAAPELNA